MVTRKNSIIVVFFVIVLGLLIYAAAFLLNNSRFLSITQGKTPVQALLERNSINHPLSIETMRDVSYPGSILIIEETLADGNNYHQYIASYISDGLKIYGLLTVPLTPKPTTGFPVILFNHGYIAPQTYITTERYVAYVDAFARNGYIVFKSDYRGHGKSGGKPEGAYYSPAYATDVLNALVALKQYNAADPNRIGMWGHSLGGNIILRDIVVNTKDIKAAVIWGGVVASYNDLLNNWHRRATYRPGPQEMTLRNTYRRNITDQYGTPETNPEFWKAIDPMSHISDITTPIQLHTGELDEEVPAEFSANFYEQLILAEKAAEYYIYPGADHDISSPNFELAMDRSIAFFNRYLK